MYPSRTAYPGVSIVEHAETCEDQVLGQPCCLSDDPKQVLLMVVAAHSSRTPHLRLFTSRSIAVLLAMMVGLLITPLHAQAAGGFLLGNSLFTSASQTAASNSIAFDVASIRPADPDSQNRSNFSWFPNSKFVPPNGRLSANLPLIPYIEFAYKVRLTPEQREKALATLPKWVATDSFVIEAQAEGNPSLDQLRMMMKTLLADRFKLEAHFETRRIPVLALVQVTHGKIGKNLRPHLEGTKCAPEPSPDPISPPPDETIPFCGSARIVRSTGRSVTVRGSDVTLAFIANWLSGLQYSGRTMIDQTGLTAKFDFSLDFTLEEDLSDSAPPAEPGKQEAPASRKLSRNSSE